LSIGSACQPVTATPPLWQCPSGRQQFCVLRRRIFQQVKHAETISFGELQTIRLLDYRPGGFDCVPNHEIRQIGVLQRYGTQKQRFFLGSNPQGHPAVVFNRYSRPGCEMYAFNVQFCVHLIFQS
jgi:hypothetical protein